MQTRYSQFPFTKATDTTIRHVRFFVALGQRTKINSSLLCLCSSDSDTYQNYHKSNINHVNIYYNFLRKKKKKKRKKVTRIEKENLNAIGRVVSG